MIQYQYFHTMEGYVSRFSISREASNFYYYNELFQSLRVATEGDTFTYATVDGDFVIMQCTDTGRGIYVKSISGDRLPEAPAKYIFKLENRVSKDDEDVDVLPSPTLPAIGRRVDDFSLAAKLHHIFPKLVDALLYSKKPVMIIADSNDSAVNYIKVLSLLLPKEYMEKVGFCIGSSSVPDGALTFTDEMGASKEISIRIWAPKIPNFDFDSYGHFYYIFDTLSGRDNYSAELSAVARSIEEINLCDRMLASDFARNISSAFYNGKVDLKELDRISAVYLFSVQRNAKTARAVLKLGYTETPDDVRIMAEAINLLLSTDKLSSSDLDSIMRICDRSREVSDEVEEKLFNYLAKRVDSLDKDDRERMLQLVSGDDSGERIKVILDSSRIGDFRAMTEYFPTAVRILNAYFKRNGYLVSKNIGAIETIIKYFDIGSFYRKIPHDQLANGEVFFDTVLNVRDNNLKSYVSAILMASAYQRNVPAGYGDVRIKGFLGMVDKMKIDPLEKLDFILLVRDCLLEISDELSELDIDGDIDFLFSHSFGDKWAKKFIASLTLGEALRGYSLIRSRTSGRLSYESMSRVVVARLLDEKFVIANARSSQSTLSEYINFFDNLPEEKKASRPGIQKYLGELDAEANISEGFSEFRCNFAEACYNTMSQANKQKVEKKLGRTPDFATLDRQNRVKAIENITEVFGTTRKRKLFGSLVMKPFVILAFAFSLLSAILLLLPPIVQTAALGPFEMSVLFDHIFAFIIPEFIFIPLYVFLLNVVTYLTLKNENRIKRSVVITLLCGVLPVFVFVASYILFYFLGFKIEIPFWN